MLALAVDLDPITTRRDGVGQARFLIQLRAHLVEVGHLQLAALADRAGVGLFFTKDQLQQRGLARAVQADQADLVAAHEDGGKIAHDHLVAVALVDVGQLGHDLARTVAGGDVELDLALLLAPRGALQTQRFKTAHAPFVTRAARLHAFANPDFFLRQELVELGVFHFLDGQLLGLARLISGEIAGEGQQATAIQFDDARGDVVEETAIMGDEEHAALVVAQQALQPLDRGEVEMVGRLVQQQHVGHADQRASQRHALLHAARKRADRHVAREIQAVQRGFDAVVEIPGVAGVDPLADGMHAFHQRIVVIAAQLRGQAVVFGQQRTPLAQARSDGLEHRLLGRKLRLLLDVGDLHALLHHEQAIVQARRAAENLQQRGLARAVTPDQADALAGFERKLGMIEQGNVAEGQLGVGKGDDCHD